MRPDDVKGALDAMASEGPSPKRDASAVIARGRRRRTQRRAAFVGIAAALVAAVAVTGAIVHTGSSTNENASARVGKSTVDRPTHRAAPEPALPTTTPTPTTVPLVDAKQYDPPPIVLGSANEAWICGSPFELTLDGGQNWRSINVPGENGARPAGEFAQPTLCTAAPGAAWQLRETGVQRGLVLTRITGAGHVESFPFAVGAVTVETIDFVDANTGWALTQSQQGDPTDTQLYATVDGGKSWTERNGHAPLGLGAPGTPFEGLLSFANAWSGWALGKRAPLETTDDGGRTWRTVSVPTLPASGDFPTFFNGVFAAGDDIVASGGTAQRTGNAYKPFFDVSTDGGRTWSMRLGPENLELPLALRGTFVAADAHHWLLAGGNRLFATDDGGQTWTERAQFAGMRRISYLAESGSGTDYVSGGGDLANPSSVTLASTDGGASWTTVYFASPPFVGSGQGVNFPGGIVGCPTYPLTTPPPGDPPQGLVAAAIANIETTRRWTPATIGPVYKVGEDVGSFGSLFRYQVTSCGKEAVDDSWVVELYGASGSGSGGSTPQAQIVLSHAADGWHVFGRYH